MKKAFKMFCGLFMFMALVVPFSGVNAINVDNIGGNVTSKKEDGVWHLTLNGGDTQDLEIGRDETVVLDLNGFTLTNFADGCSTIWVKPGGTLTIVDSKGNGAIKKLNASGAPVVNNEGTLTVEAGTISSKGEKSAALLNSGTLTVSGGTITAEEDNVFGLVNEGTAVINGGNFVQAHNFSVVNNANKMEIKDGNFTVEDGNTGAYSLITNQGSTNNATLEVNGGTFKANKGVFYNDGEDEITVSGGTYSHDVSAYLADGFEMKEENGEFVLVEETTTSETPKDENEPTQTTETVENPKTNDSILLVLGTLAVSGVVAFVAKRKLS